MADLCQLCLFSTRANARGGYAARHSFVEVDPKGLEDTVKKVALALVLVVTSLSLGGCFVGKGKAPAPVVTKG